MRWYREGLTLDLRKLEISDLPVVTEWIASPDFIEQVAGTAVESNESSRAMAERLIHDNANDQSQNCTLIAVDRQDGTLVGLALVCKIDWKNRHAEYAYIIGSQRHRGTLAAGDMNVIIYGYLFEELGLNKVYGFVYADNDSSFRINQFGGQIDGRLRRHQPKSQGWRDVIVFSITENSFKNFVNQNAKGVLRKHIARKLLKCG
jgi:RimJ/RimL family protein N-acetyltransferase